MPKQISLTKGYKAIVDDDDYECASNFKWYAHSCSSNVIVAARRESVRNGRKLILLHRFIMNAPDSFQVDHINHQPLDCRKNNLRLATPAQNSYNKRLSRRSKTGYKGVFFTKGGYTVSIRFKGKQSYIGRFASAIKAAKAYDEAAELLFGDFACLNFPKPQNLEKTLTTHLFLLDR